MHRHIQVGETLDAVAAVDPTVTVTSPAPNATLLEGALDLPGQLTQTVVETLEVEEHPVAAEVVEVAGTAAGVALVALLIRRCWRRAWDFVTRLLTT